MSPLITISMLTYSQSVTLLSMLRILTQHHQHPTSFSQLTITILVTITAMHSAIGFGVTAPMLAFLTIFIVWRYLHPLPHIHKRNSNSLKRLLFCTYPHTSLNNYISCFSMLVHTLLEDFTLLHIFR